MMSAVPVSPDVDEALRRAGAVWVALDDLPPVLVWHLWHDDALWLVSGGPEQPLPGAATAVRAAVTVRSPAGQVLVWGAAVQQVRPGTEDWDAVVPLLADKRLNAAHEGVWAEQSVVLRLSPAP